MVVLVVALLASCDDEHHDRTGSGGPAAPTNFMVSNVGGGAHLTWTDVADDEDHYMVMRKTGGAYEVIATLPFNAIQYHDSAIAAGTTYVYQVIAMNARGQGASDEITFTP
jgi:hypothetical protein